MNKKYLILKKKPIKGKYSTTIGKKSLIPTVSSFGIANNLTGVNDNVLGMPNNNHALQNAVTNIGSDVINDVSTAVNKGKSSLTQTDLNAKLAGVTFGSDNNNDNNDKGTSGANLDMAAGAATGLASAGINNIIDRNTRDRETRDSFGDIQVDRKSIIGGSTLDSAMSWGDAGSQIGSLIPIPGGKLIGRGIGMLAGAGKGLISGNKDADEAEEKQAEALTEKINFVKRNNDLENSNAILAGETGFKLGKFSLPKKKSKLLYLKTGGKIEKTGKINVVASGKMHRENNDLGNKDKGIPIINSKGVKEYEIEAGEIIFNQNTTNKIESFIKEYDEKKDESVFEKFGEFLTKELLKNTKDNYGKFKVKVKK